MKCIMQCQELKLSDPKDWDRLRLLELIMNTTFKNERGNPVIPSKDAVKICGP